MSEKCPVCESSTEKIQHPTFGKYFSCGVCEFIFKSREEIITSTTEKNIYDQHNNSIDQEGYVDFLYGFLHNALFPYIHEYRKGLDFGSGPTPVLAEILQEYHGCSMDIYDLFYSPKKVYRNKKYDFITSTEVAEHLINPMEYFRLFKELLHDNGVLAVMTLFHPRDLNRFISWHYIRDKSHVSFYSIKTMEYIANNIGLEIIYTNDNRYVTFTKR